MKTPNLLKSRLFCAAAIAALVLGGCSSKEEKSIKFTESGYEYLEQGDLVTARLEFNNALSNNYENVDALIGLSKILEEEKEYIALARTYKKILLIDENHYEANLGLAKIYLLARDTDNAQAQIDVILSTKPQDNDALSVGAAIMIIKGQTDEARALASEILERDPTNSEVYNILAAEQIAIENFEGALAIIEEGIVTAEDPSSLYPVKLLLTERIRDDAAVIATFKEMVEIYPDNDIYRRQYADFLLIKMRDYDGAREKYLELVADSDDEDEKTKLLVKVIEVTYQAEGKEAAIDQLKGFISENPKSAELQFTLADMYCRFDDEDGCKRELEAIIKSTKEDDVEWRAENGLVLLALKDGNMEIAENKIEKILKGDPANPAALSSKARLHILNEEYDEAIGLLRTAQEGEPENTNIMIMLAAAYEKTGSTKFAASQFAKAASIDDKDSKVMRVYRDFLLRTDEIDRAIEVTEEYVAAVPTDVSARIFMVQSRLRKQEWIAARRNLDVLKKISPENEAIAPLETGILIGEGNLEDAVPLLEEMVARDATGPAVTELVNSYLGLTQYDKAITLLNERVAAEPDNVNNTLQLVTVYLAASRIDDGVALAEEAVAKSPKFEAVYRSLYNAKVLSGDQAGAVKVLRDGIANVEQTTALEVLLSSELINTGEFDEAMTLLNGLYERFPENTVIINNIASLLLETSDNSEDWQRALAMTERFRTSENPFFLDTLAWAYYKNGELGKAEGFSSRAVTVFENNADLQYHYGIISYEYGNETRGREALRKALSMAGENNYFIDKDLAEKYINN